jgi:ABC-type xylose transport system permease subunit
VRTLNSLDPSEPHYLLDLSVGSVLAVSGGVLGVAMVQWHLPVRVAMIACVLVGAFCGLINGELTVRFQLPSFIVTLGMLEAARGAAYLVTNSQTQYIGADIEQVNDCTIVDYHSLSSRHDRGRCRSTHSNRYSLWLIYDCHWHE